MDVDPADDTPLPSSPFSTPLFALLFPPDEDEFMVGEARVRQQQRRNNTFTYLEVAIMQHLHNFLSDMII